ncbi:Crp/Fnr family transcriptional regulator [Blautia sp.]|nr:Crp/Fnr family transcriptional regulator [Blautia sp.]
MTMNLFQIPLFYGLKEGDFQQLKELGCIHQQFFTKNTTIFHMGDIISQLGIVLSGSVRVENTDLWGKRSILSHISCGQVFAETYALCQEPMMVSAVASEDSEILFLDLKRLQEFSPPFAPFSSVLLQNLLQISMQKNLILSNRIFCTTPKTIRERLLIYLTAQAMRANSTVFEIPFDRQQMADYLNLDRSALSKELGKMKKEGILEFHKNQFILHKKLE